MTSFLWKMYEAIIAETDAERMISGMNASSPAENMHTKALITAVNSVMASVK